MKKTTEVDYLTATKSDIQTFRDFLEIIEDSGFDDESIYSIMTAIANKENKVYAFNNNFKTLIAKITYI